MLTYDSVTTVVRGSLRNERSKTLVNEPLMIGNLNPLLEEPNKKIPISMATTIKYDIFFAGSQVSLVIEEAHEALARNAFFFSRNQPRDFLFGFRRALSSSFSCFCFFRGTRCRRDDVCTPHVRETT